MAQRTVSIPQRNAFGKDAHLYEVLARLTAAVNAALTLPTAPSTPVTASGTITLSNPVARVAGPVTIKTIAPVDFGVPIFLIAATGDVRLGTGGNIGSSALISAGTAMCLIPEAATGIWWPAGGGSGGAALAVEESDGVPSVAGVSTIKFDGATVTDDTGGVVTVTITPPAPSVGDFLVMQVFS